MHSWKRISGFVLATLLTGLVAVSAVSCAETATQESTGQYVDDSTITTKVKTQLVKDSMTNGFQIQVETYKGTVQLSGFVDSDAAKERAEQIARQVNGVKDVENSLVVKTSE